MADGTPQWALPPGQQQQAQQHPGYATQQPPAAQPAPTAPPQAPLSGGVAVVSPPPSTGVPAKANKFNRIAQMEEKVLVTRTRDEETEDGRLVNKEALTKIRDAWVYKRVRSRVREFTTYRQVRQCIQAIDADYCAIHTHTRNPFYFFYCNDEIRHSVSLELGT